MALMWESLLLMAIGLADLAYTLVLLKGRTAIEGNPLMSFYLGYGVAAFVIAKLTLLLFPVFIAEWSKAYKPKFVKWMMRGAIAAYIGTYVILFVSVNVLPASHATPVVQVAEQAR